MNYRRNKEIDVGNIDGRRISLSEVYRVSGPVSMSVFDVGSQNRNGEGAHHRLLLFGDEHHSVEKACRNCTKDKRCVHVSELIGLLESEVTEKQKSMDVFFEFPYVVSKGKLRADFVDYIDRYMKSSRDSRRHNIHARVARFVYELKKRLKRLFSIVFSFPLIIGGESNATLNENEHNDNEKIPSQRHADTLTHGPPKKTGGGVLESLYVRYSRDVYNHNEPNYSCIASSRSSRFHFTDARWEPNVWIYIKPPFDDPRGTLAKWIIRFHHDIPNTQTYEWLLRSFLFGTNFPLDIRHIYGHDAPIIYSSLSGKKVHKIAKQFHKLGIVNPALQEKVNTYLNDRIHKITDVLRFDVNYDALIGGNSASLLPFYMYPHKLKEFIRLARQSTPVLLMDAYLLCRLLYFMETSQKDGGYVIVYAGDSHIRCYIDFFENYIRAAHVMHSVSARKKNGRRINRCVKVKL